VTKIKNEEIFDYNSEEICFVLPQSERDKAE
jgi:hypothetical protein